MNDGLDVLSRKHVYIGISLCLQKFLCSIPIYGKNIFVQFRFMFVLFFLQRNMPRVGIQHAVLQLLFGFLTV